jgi:acyl carrier protein
MYRTGDFGCLLPDGQIGLGRKTLLLDANSKSDREDLPEPSGQTRRSTAGFRAPESPVQIQMAAILGDLLNLGRVGLDDNFFLLGGHSLLGVELVHRIRERFGLELTRSQLYESQTLDKLALLVENLWVERIESMSEEEATMMLEEMERV